MTVSIIVPVRDGERYLAPALRSLLDQERPPDELIVVDDGSPTRARRSPRRSARACCASPRLGPAVARNAGVRRPPAS